MLGKHVQSFCVENNKSAGSRAVRLAHGTRNNITTVIALSATGLVFLPFFVIDRKRISLDELDPVTGKCLGAPRYIIA